MDRFPVAPVGGVGGTLLGAPPPALEHRTVDCFVYARCRGRRSFVGRRTDGPVEGPRYQAISSVRDLAVRIGDRRGLLGRVDDDGVAEDEPCSAGSLHQPLQRQLRQRIARVPAAYVRMRADEPALLDLVYGPLRSA